jgi:hypothetical protein
MDDSILDNSIKQIDGKEEKEREGDGAYILFAAMIRK